MKKYISIILAVILAMTLAGCVVEETQINVNVEGGDDLSGGLFGKSALVEIGDHLWYDSTTRIVYWWNGCLALYNYSTTPSPYYAPNGLPYRYNPETNTFEEITNGN